MTGRPGYRTMEMNGGTSAPYLARTPCVPLFVHYLMRVETEGLLDYQGRAEDHFHCTVEPSPGHIRCRQKAGQRRQPGFFLDTKWVCPRAGSKSTSLSGTSSN